MARNKTEALEEYEAARSAYLNALKCQEYSISSGGTSTTKRNQYINQLREEMNRCAQELARYEGGGIKMSGGVPAW